jgi:hypothetical protein
MQAKRLMYSFMLKSLGQLDNENRLGRDTTAFIAHSLINCFYYYYYYYLFILLALVLFAPTNFQISLQQLGDMFMRMTFTFTTRLHRQYDLFAGKSCTEKRSLLQPRKFAHANPIEPNCQQHATCYLLHNEKFEESRRQRIMDKGGEGII